MFNSNFENQTDVIFSACGVLSNLREAFINLKSDKVLGAMFLSEIENWELAKGETKRSQAIFTDLEYQTKPSHLAFAFIIKNITDLINFTVTLLDGNGKKNFSIKRKNVHKSRFQD